MPTPSAAQAAADRMSTTTNTGALVGRESSDDHARSNAKAWCESLVEYVAKLTREGAAGVYVASKSPVQLMALLNEHEVQEPMSWSADDLDETRERIAELIADETLEPDDFEFDDEAAREEIQESPLSVQVRSGWTDPGGEMEASEFEILLTTGGPALRIRGELDDNKEPDRAWLEYQDWGTPWTQYFDVEQATLLAYCRCFYFGE